MTDKELIRALRHCASDDEYGCLGCPGEKNCDAIAGGGKSLLDAADRLEALLAENEHLREVTKMMPRWVSVKERLPEGNSTVLVYRPGMTQKILLVRYGKFWEVLGKRRRKVHRVRVRTRRNHPLVRTPRTAQH